MVKKLFDKIDHKTLMVRDYGQLKWPGSIIYKQNGQGLLEIMVRDYNRGLWSDTIDREYLQVTFTEIETKVN